MLAFIIALLIVVIIGSIVYGIYKLIELSNCVERVLLINLKGHTRNGKKYFRGENNLLPKTAIMSIIADERIKIH